jgi:hypothetical protein
LRLNCLCRPATFALNPPVSSPEGFSFTAITQRSERNYALAKSIENAAGYFAYRDAPWLRHL